MTDRDSGQPKGPPGDSERGPRDQARRRALRLLVLRHLHDGDVIDYPVAEDHTHRAIVEELEGDGFIARWDRIWPLHDRYRLTEKGIAEIERVYRPEQWEKDMAALRQQNLGPEERRRYLQQRGYHDPYAATVIHDPHSDWEVWDYDDPGPTFEYVFSGWETNQDLMFDPVPEPVAPPSIVEDLDTAPGHTPEADHPSLDVS